MPQQQQQQSEGHDHFTTSDDDNEMMKEILATHADHHNYYNKVDVNPHLQLIEEILRHSTTLKRTNIHEPKVSSHMKSLDEKFQKVDSQIMLEALAYIIHKISCEISCECSRGEDAHSTTVALFTTLSKFSWDAKVVVALAAFAIIYGEFWLVEELYATHPLANSVALLKQLPHIFEQQSEKLMRPRFSVLWGPIKGMLDVTKCIVQLHELPPQYISPDDDQSPLSVATAHIPTAVYWTIRTVVACTFQIIGFIGLDRHKYIISIYLSLPSLLSIPLCYDHYKIADLFHRPLMKKKKKKIGI
ncbi:protein SIEVE ELEMENT OCCLUSION B-like [Telopea speciosissima]|uniref:protein SIEVE ELEMENT OCCLUSION B-like n=1 Tax=Telopea speciosissima TaxID=54955 RepID=UPI001CC473E7|nr:protein SIEVE ELEMENT OCCLUSION B-like [Telopea speciosissima]